MWYIYNILHGVYTYHITQAINMNGQSLGMVMLEATQTDGLM